VLSNAGMVNTTLHSTSRTFYMQRKTSTSVAEDEKYAPYDDQTYFGTVLEKFFFTIRKM